MTRWKLIGPEATGVTVFPFASELQRGEVTGGQVDAFLRGASALGEFSFRLASPGEPIGGIPVILSLTGGIEGRILAAWPVVGGRPAARPVVAIIAHPEANSLPAALETAAAINAAGGKALVIPTPSLDGASHLPALERYLRLHRAARELGEARLGLIGGPSDWLVASSPDPSAITANWGPAVIRIPMDELMRECERESERECVAAAAAPAVPPPEALELLAQATAVREPSPATLTGAVAIYRALARVIERHHLTAVSVRCFDLLTFVRNTGCYALSRLNDEGIVAGCEGDLPATLTMMLLRALRSPRAVGSRDGRPGCDGDDGHTGLSFMANPAWIDELRSEVTLAHCTIPLGLTSEFELRSHFESGLGVAFGGRWPPGPVTIARLAGPALDRLVALEGEVSAAAVAAPSSERLCRTQVTVRLDAPGAARNLLRDPPGNHLVAARGRRADELREFVALFGPGR
jgi:L-fucose isomerase-like protein